MVRIAEKRGFVRVGRQGLEARSQRPALQRAGARGQGIRGQGQRPGDRGQKAARQRVGTEGQRPEVRKPEEMEGRSQRTEDGSQRSEIRGQRPEARGQGIEVRSQEARGLQVLDPDAWQKIRETYYNRSEELPDDQLEEYTCILGLLKNRNGEFYKNTHPAAKWK